MRTISWAMLAWTVLWIGVVWALDPASTVGGKPPAWALFELWAAGFVLLGAVRADLLPLPVAERVRVDWRRLRSTGGAVVVWTVLWMLVFPIWALDPHATDIGSGPSPYTPVTLKPSEPLLYGLWAVGLALLGGVWVVARARSAGRRRP